MKVTPRSSLLRIMNSGGAPWGHHIRADLHNGTKQMTHVLTSPESFYNRTMTEVVPSVCPHDCPSACALEIKRLPDGSVGQVRAAKDQAYTAGVLCGKVARYAARIHHPERLKQPLIRNGAKGSGAFRPIDWTEALDLVANRFQLATRKHGPEAVWPYYYAGSMGLVAREGINRLRHAMGYSGQHSTICTTLAYAGWTAGVGALYGPDPLEMANSDLIVIWGCNAAATQVNVMTHITRARCNRAAQLVVIDPYRNATAKAADLHIMPRPGTDGALACAVMHQLFANGHADRDYLSRYTDAPDELETHLSERTPAWGASITGVPEDQIRSFAKLYGQTPRSFIRMGIGFSRSRNGAHNVHAVSCLPAVTGAWRHRGGGALLSTSDLFPLDLALITGAELRNPDTRMLDQSRIGHILTGDAKDLGNGPPVTAMLIQNTNPMAVAPDLNRVHEGFAREDLFVCVHEQFLTETARMADVVLPATMFLEHDDLYRSYGQTFLQIGRKVIEPPPDCRSNHHVICELGRRLGANHPGFGMTELELIDATLRHSGCPDAATLTSQRWQNKAPDFATGHFINGFAWPDGRFRFKPDWAALGPLGHLMPALPDHWDVIEASDATHPFRLIAPPAHNFLNSSFTETPRSRAKEGQPKLKLHPDDAAKLGITDGALVEVGNQRGVVDVHAQLYEHIGCGVIAVEGIWPGCDFPGGAGINTLTSAEPGAPNGGAVFHDTAVWVRLKRDAI